MTSGLSFHGRSTRKEVKQMPKTKKGFTLIELLVVIAIIGILSAIGLVSLNGAREKARDSKRESDLAQIRSAMALYYDDNSSAYPNSTGTINSGGTKTGSFVSALNPYIPTLPVPPSNGSGDQVIYSYVVNTTAPASAFELYSKLEGTVSGLQQPYYYLNSSGTGGTQAGVPTCAASSCTP